MPSKFIDPMRTYRMSGVFKYFFLKTFLGLPFILKR